MYPHLPLDHVRGFLQDYYHFYRIFPKIRLESRNKNSFQWHAYRPLFTIWGSLPDRDPLDRDPLPLDRDPLPLNRNPPGQRPPVQRPLGQRPPCHVICDACWDRTPPPLPVDRQTPVKTSPSQTSFVGGKNGKIP